MNRIPKATYTFISIFVISLVGLWVRSCSNDDTAPASTAEQVIIKNIPDAYTLVMIDDEGKGNVDVEPIKYHTRNKSTEWVQLKSQGRYSRTYKDVLGGNTYKASVGFNPQTLTGSWSKMYKFGYILQKGTCTLVPNAQGGFEIIFHAENGHGTTRGTVLPAEY